MPRVNGVSPGNPIRSPNSSVERARGATKSGSGSPPCVRPSAAATPREVVFADFVLGGSFRFEDTVTSDGSRGPRI